MTYVKTTSIQNLCYCDINKRKHAQTNDRLSYTYLRRRQHIFSKGWNLFTTQRGASYVSQKFTFIAVSTSFLNQSRYREFIKSIQYIHNVLQITTHTNSHTYIHTLHCIILHSANTHSITHTKRQTEMRKYSTAARKTAYNLSGLYTAFRYIYFLIGLQAKPQQSFSGSDKIYACDRLHIYWCLDK